MLGLALAGAMMASCAVEARAPIASGPVAAVERDVVARVNRHRRSIGLAPLSVDAAITRQARLHSQAMASGATPAGHRGFDDRVAAIRRAMRCRRAAENVALNRGYEDPAAEAMRGWLGSAGHRENIEGAYQVTGVGAATDRAGNVYLTQIFVAP